MSPYANVTNAPNLSGLSGGWLSKKAKQVKKAAKKVTSNVKGAARDVTKAVKENADTILVVGAIAMPLAGGIAAGVYGAGKATQEKKKADAEAKRMEKEARAMEAQAAAAEAAEGQKPKMGAGKILGIVGAAAAGLFLVTRKH